MTVPKNFNMYQSNYNATIGVAFPKHDLLFPTLETGAKFETGDLSSSLAPEKDFQHNIKSHSKNFLFFFASDAEEEHEEDDGEEEYLELDDDILDESDSEFESVHLSESDEESEYDIDNFDFEQPERDLPFWFSHEDEEHIHCIFEMYSKCLISPQDLQNRSSQPFIGRIERTVACCDNDCFQTFDCVTVYNCQRMPMNNLNLPLMKQEYCVASYNQDGIPCCITKLTADQVNYWKQRLNGNQTFYLYSQPDWYHQGTVEETEFFYTSSKNFHDITYHGLPARGKFAPFVSHSIPKRLRVPVKEGLVPDC